MVSLINFINSIYTFHSPITTCSKFEMDTMNDNFILSGDNEKYFLKKYRLDVVGNEEHINEIHRVEDLFSINDIPVLKSIKSRENKSYFSFENDFYTLYPFVIAESVKDSKELMQEQVISLAHNLARIHIVGKGRYEFKELQKYSQWTPDKFFKKYPVLKEIIKQKEYKDDLDLKLLNLLDKRFEFISSIKPKNYNFSNDHLIHGDYHERNLFFEDNNIKYIFDWEKTSIYPRAIELARSLEIMFLTDYYAEKNDISIAKLYLKEYSKIYPLDKTELIEGLNQQFLNRISSLWAESEYYINHRRQGKDLILNGISKIEYLIQNNDKLIDDLTREF